MDGRDKSAYLDFNASPISSNQQQLYNPNTNNMNSNQISSNIIIPTTCSNSSRLPNMFSPNHYQSSYHQYHHHHQSPSASVPQMMSLMPKSGSRFSTNSNVKFEASTPLANYGEMMYSNSTNQFGRSNNNNNTSSSGSLTSNSRYHSGSSDRGKVSL